MKNKIWTEKYRPKTIHEVIGAPDSIKNAMKEPDRFPHLFLFSKKPGTGKTTIAKALIKDLKAEGLFLNASDERKIEDIREKVKRFAETVGFSNSRKIVFLDECDGMPKLSQEALRSIIERYNAIFILTANNKDKIIEPLQSRCMPINLQFPDKKEVINLLKKIGNNENIKISDEALEKLCDLYYPSIRNMIIKMQELSYFGKEINVDDITKDISHYFKLYEQFKKGNILQIRKEWIEKGYDLRELIKNFFEFVMNDEQLSIANKKTLINIIAESDYRMALGSDNDITMFWAIMQMRRYI